MSHLLNDSSMMPSADIGHDTTLADLRTDEAQRQPLPNWPPALAPFTAGKIAWATAITNVGLYRELGHQVNRLFLERLYDGYPKDLDQPQIALETSECAMCRGQRANSKGSRQCLGSHVSLHRIERHNKIACSKIREFEQPNIGTSPQRARSAKALSEAF